MKKLLMIFSLIVFNEQVNAQAAPAVEIANKFADKMHDSLNLSQGQRAQVFAINIQLFNEKVEARSLHANRDSLGLQLQRIENKRDSLYKKVIEPEKFLLYQQKKRHLINNN